MHVFCEAVRVLSGQWTLCVRLNLVFMFYACPLQYLMKVRPTYLTSGSVSFQAIVSPNTSLLSWLSLTALSWFGMIALVIGTSCCCIVALQCVRR